MKRFLVLILCALFSTSVQSHKQKITKEITEIKQIKNIKPLLDETKAKEILEMGGDDIKENYEIKNEKYIYTAEDKQNEKDAQISQKEENNIKILTENYKNILNLSSSCCVANIAEQIKLHNMDKTKTRHNIIDLLSFDANSYYIQNTCLLLSDQIINQIVRNKDLNNIFKRTRKDCICNNQEFLYKNIKNFQKLYETDSNFYKTKFIYKSKDDQGRIIEQDMNETVLNILQTLDTCIK